MKQFFKTLTFERVFAVFISFLLVAIYWHTPKENLAYAQGQNQSGTSQTVGGAIWVNAGEAIFCNNSGNYSAAVFLMVVRQQLANGTTVTTSASSTATASPLNAPVFAEGSTIPYVAFASSGWLVFASCAPQVGSSQMSTGQAFINIMHGCSNAGLTGSGSLAVATFNTCTGLIVLQQGNSSLFEQISWPSPLIPPTWGPGALQIIPGTAPGAGNNFALVLSSLYRAKITGIFFVLTTNATAGNRFPVVSLTCNSGAQTMGQWASSIAVPASTTGAVSYTPGIGGPFNSGVGGTTQFRISVPLPTQGLQIGSVNCAGTQAATGLNIFVDGIQSGDTLTAISIWEEAWEENN